MTLPTITSASNQRIRNAAALRDSRKRRKSGNFLIDGVREIRRASLSGIRIREIYAVVEDDGPDPLTRIRCSSELRTLLDQFERERIPVWPVVKNVFAKLAFGDRDEGIVALADEPIRSFEVFEASLPENPLLGVLEQIEKPGNIGAVFRSADGAGLDGIILVDCGQDLWHPNIIRSSLGTVFRVPSVTAGAEEVAAWLKKRRIRVAAAICDAAVPYSSVDYTCPTAIVLGNEANGLSEVWRDKTKIGEDSSAIVLPMLGIADSLNISNAAAILFYHALLVRSENNR